LFSPWRMDSCIYIPFFWTQGSAIIVLFVIAVLKLGCFRTKIRMSLPLFIFLWTMSRDKWQSLETIEKLNIPCLL
jgi:hypothetical protein